MKKEIMLILTEKCNLSCTYCFEHHKSIKKMNFETARIIIDKEMNVKDDIEGYQSTLFGGEPFLEMELIKKIYYYVEENIGRWNKKVNIFVNTNGTLLDDDVKEWLRKRRKYIYCGLSLDGTREMHNINRSNSFDRIDLDFFRECWPNQIIKMTISKETLPKLAEGVIFIHEKGFDCGCTFAYGLEWSKELVNILKEQLCILEKFYIEHINYPLCQILNINISVLLKDKKDRYKRCGAGENMMAYDTEGKKYPCHSFSTVSLGESAKLFENYTLPIEDIIDEERCIKCQYYLICPTCYGVNYSYTGNIGKRNRWLCDFFKLCVSSSVRIQFYRLRSKKMEELDKKDYETLMAINKWITTNN